MSDSLVQIGGQEPRPGPAGRRPEWLRIRLGTPKRYHRVRELVERLDLNTVCKEARCPNIYECWGEHGTATFMILGDVCTRRCGFCAVRSGRPDPGVDVDEPDHIAEAVQAMSLEHVVITSVDRDDLRDAGASHFAAVIRAIHNHCPNAAVEVLTPDFRGVPGALDTVLAAEPEVFSHNMETVPRLYRQARPGSRYDRSLALLREAADRAGGGGYSGRVK
ncbi:MAG: lipoyl synthase, partial [Acidobacteriota bacterium]